MKTQKKVIRTKFRDWDCTVHIRQYLNGNGIAICLEEFGTGEPIATATINLEGVPLANGYVHIKEYSENKGITKALVDAGVVEWNGEQIYIGPFNSEVNLCKLLIE